MKFVVNSRQKDAFLMLPAEKRIGVMEGVFAFIDKYRSVGKCKEIYEHADFKGAVSVWEVESDEETAKLIMENPIAPFSDLEISPVVEWDVAVKATKEAFQKLAK